MGLLRRLSGLWLASSMTLILACSSAAPPVSSVAPPSASPAATASPAPPPTSAATPAPTPAATLLPTPTATAAATARTVTSDDGLLTIDVPAGALPDDVTLTATAKGQADLPPELDGVNVRSAFYRLEPDGLTFAAPVLMTRRVSLAALGIDPEVDGLPIVVQAVRTSDGSWSWLDDQHLTTKDGFLVITGFATHTSNLFGFSGARDLEYHVGPRDKGDSSLGTWSAGVTLNFDPESTDPPEITGVEPALTDTEVAGSTGAAVNDGEDYYEEFNCRKVGSTDLGLAIDIGNIGADSALMRDKLKLMPTFTRVDLSYPINCTGPVPSVAPASDVPASGLGEMFAEALQDTCIRVVHEPLQKFLSHLDWIFWWPGWDGLPVQVDHFELTLEGASNGKPVRIAYDPADSSFHGQFGLNDAGSKKITKLTAFLADGTEYDATALLTEALGTTQLKVRYPQQDTFGACHDF